MEQLADNVYRIREIPPNANAYLVGDVLVDAGTRWNVRRVLKQLRGRNVRVHALTHVHPPTQGASHRVCAELGLEVWCGEGDVQTMESGNVAAAQPKRWFNRFQQRVFAGPGHPVAKALREGDEVAGFQVLETPGHSPGHITLWRQDDRMLIIGDVVTNENVWTGMPGLREPPLIFTPDPARNRASARKLAELEPSLVCFGHGAPLRDPQKFVRFVQSLPADASGP